MTLVRVTATVAVLILLQTVTVLRAPLGTEARSAAKGPRIGVLGERSPADPFLDREGARTQNPQPVLLQADEVLP
jgi:hypothetical protein